MVLKESSIVPSSSKLSKKVFKLSTNNSLSEAERSFIKYAEGFIFGDKEGLALETKNPLEELADPTNDAPVQLP